MAILEHIDVKKRLSKGPVAVLSSFLDKRLVMFLEAGSQKEAISGLIDLLDRQKKLHAKGTFFEAIMQRERIVSTGIGIGVAIPHAKLEGYRDFFIAIGIKKGEGIEWGAIDGLPVRLVFMIGGPENEQTQYLNILSMITSAIKDEKRLKSLLKAETEEDVIALFQDF